MGFAKKILRPDIRRRIFYERLTEPLHLNLLSLGVALFGSFRQKVGLDLVIRNWNAYGLLRAADLAKKHGFSEMTALEFGVAAGAGLMNMDRIARRVEAATGVKIHLTGFDTGKGMPPAVDYRDHPEHYMGGDFPMNVEKVRAALPSDVELVLGELKDTLPKWVNRNLEKRPIGYVVFDVDYYSSTVDAMTVLKGSATNYLPFVVVYLDDILYDEHNSWCGELPALNEFNESSKFRKMERPTFITLQRAFKRTPWLQQMFFCHVLDHPDRQADTQKSRPAAVLANPYF
jgi:hypothetical protein